MNIINLLFIASILCKEDEIATFTIVEGGAFILIGLIIAFFGLKMFRLIISILAMKFGVMLVASLAKYSQYDNHTVVLTIGIIVGILFGILALCIETLALIIMASSLGFFLGFLIDSMLVTQDFYIRSGVIVGSILICLILILFLKKLIIIIGTSIEGSILFMSGVDYFFNKGFESAFKTFTKIESYDIWLMMGTVVGLALLAFIFQVKVFYMR